MKTKRNLLILLALLVAGGAYVVWPLLVNAPKGKSAQGSATPPPVRGPGLQEAAGHTERRTVPAHSVAAAPTPSPLPEITERPRKPVAREAVKLAPGRIYTGTFSEPPEPAPKPQETQEEAPGDYAPYGRMVRCKLVFTVDSSSGMSTPIIGVVTEDVKGAFGAVVIHRCSEVHGQAQIDKMRERVGAEGLWTFVLNDPSRPGERPELVVQGQAMDREDDPAFKTYAITDGGAGIRGTVIKSDNMAELKLFAATLISGGSQGLKSTGTNVFGATYNNPNGRGAGGLSGVVINPVVQGAQSVLDLYAQRILDAIERDGVFLRVPAGKEFYVYVKEKIIPGKATLSGDAARRRQKDDFIRDRKRDEEITETRETRELRAQAAAQNEAASPAQDPRLDGLNQSLETTRQNLEARVSALQARSEALRPQPDKTQP
jgi:hypothetical protein